jgi:S1-C subfamily serine protease
MTKLNFAAIFIAGSALTLSPGPVVAQAPAKAVSLGIQFAGNPENDEAEVMKMLPGRTGAAMGFKVGDILTEAGGKPVSREVLTDYLKDKKEGDQLSFKVRRGDNVIELTGKAMAAPPITAQPAE